MKAWCGVDPGNGGAIALIYEDGDIMLYDAPTAKVVRGKREHTVLLPDEMAQFFMGSGNFQLHVYVEQVSAMKGQGVTSMFNFGMGYGMWLGVLAALAIPYTLVTPQRWKKAMMAGMGTEKDASIVQAKRLFPQVADQLARKKDHGRADALLIAALCRKENP